MTGVLVQELHALARCHAVHNVQTNHDNQLTWDDGPETCPRSCNARTLNQCDAQTLTVTHANCFETYLHKEDHPI